MKTIETTARIDENNRLVPDSPLPPGTPGRVHLIIFVSDEQEDESDAAYLKAAMGSPSFDFLKEPSEDVYTAFDGRPFHAEG